MPLYLISRSLKLLTVTSCRTFSKNTLKVVPCRVPFNGVFYSSKPASNIILEKNPETGESKKKKTAIIPKITLLSGNDISITTIEEAQKLAKRRDLKLVKITDLDNKTQRAVYRLLSGAEYLEEDLKQKEKKKSQKQTGFKGEKMVMISHNIFEHDLDIHIAKIVKWLSKNYEVKMVINGSSENMTKAEHVYSLIEKKIKVHNSRIVQKRVKGSDIKFQILPPKADKNATESGNNANLSTGGSGNSVSNEKGGGKSL